MPKHKHPAHRRSSSPARLQAAARPAVAAARRPAAEPLEPRSYFAGVGQGLVAEYFADQSFGRLAHARTDATVNFTWPAAPAAAVPADQYSVRWTGQVLAEKTETYTFFAGSAGGVRVFVNGQKVIDNWASHGQTENSGTIALKAGQYYPIQVDYREDGNGSVKLSWSSPTTAKQVIPKSQLYRAGSAPVTGGWLQGNVGAGNGSVLGSGAVGGYDVGFGQTTIPPTVPPAGPALDLLNSVNDTVIAPLTNGYVIDLGQTGTRLNIRATPAGPTGSLAFVLDGNLVKTETFAPYSIGGDSNGGFDDWTPPLGTHTLQVIQYSGTGGTGSVQGSTTVSFTAVGPQSPPPPTGTVSLRPTADAYGLNGSTANTNYGNSGELQVRLSSVAGHAREAFLRFDLSQVASADKITSAVVRLTGRLSQAGSVNLGLFPLTNGTNWSEAGLTWNNKPASGSTAIGALRTLTNTANAAVEFDVTSYLKQQKQAGASVVNLAIKATNYTTPFVIFASDEAAANRPELRVTQNTAPPPPPTPQIVLSQSKASVVEGGTSAQPTVRLSAQPAADVTVTIARTGGDEDLTVSPAVLVFTPADWATPQGLTLSAAEDDDALNSTALFVLSAPGMANADLTVSEQDDDVANPAGPALDLLNSVDDSVIAPLTSGYVIDMNQTGTRLNIRATPVGTAGSVVFVLDGKIVSNESFAPYSVGGDTNGMFNDWTPTPGGHTLVVTQYAGPGGTGEVQGSTTVTFTAIAPQTPPPPVTSTVSLRAIDDAHALDGPSADVNYGQGPEMRVRLSSFPGNWRESFVRFDLSQVASAGQITSAVLRLAGRLSGPGSVNVGLFPLTGGTGWTENGLTWNNKPTSGNTPVTAVKTITNTADAVFEYDLTTFLKQQKQAGATVVNLAIKATNYTSPHVNILSDEAAGGRPELRVTQQQPAAAPVFSAAPLQLADAAADEPSGTAAAASTGPIGGSADGFHYLYKVVRGDGYVQARVNPVVTGGAEAGLVIRPDLNTSAASIGLTVGSAGVSFEARTAAGTTATATDPVAVTGPVFLKLTRDGNSFAGYYATAGMNGPWTLVGTAGADVGTFAYFGLAGGSTAGAFTGGFAEADVRPTVPLGGNLNNPSDRVQDLPFVDLVKTTRGFYNTAGRTAANGRTDFAASDANGWPTEDFSFNAIDNSEWNVPADAGTYKLRFTGPAGTTVTAPAGVTVANRAYDANTGVHTYDVVVGGNVLVLNLRFAGTQGQVKNIKLAQPGYAVDSAATFTDKYLNLLRTTGPSTLRLMDWTKANGDMEVNWADRPLVTDATQARAVAAGELQPGKGVAWEYGIQLANQLGRNVWVNVPVRASDDYVRSLANLLRTTLRADLNIYVEHSNEVWNTAFEQATYNINQAVNEVFANPSSDLNYDNKPIDRTKPGASNPQANTWADRRHARRTKQIADLFRQAWTTNGEADPINKRVRVVLAGQASFTARFDNELAYLNARHGTPRNSLYGIGVAPYFGLNKYVNSPNATKDQVLEGFNLSVSSYANAALPDALFTKAKGWGLRMIGYEGGPDTFGTNNIANKRLASLDPAMQQVVVRYLNNWYNRGGDLFNWYTIGARSFNTPFGTWSITEDADVLDAPKVKGFQQVRNGLPVSTTAHGVFA